MLNDMKVSYINKNSVIHNFNSTFKVISFIILLLSAFFINSYEDIIMLSSYLILSLVNSDINIKIYLKKMYQYIAIFVIILIIDIITFSSIDIIICDLFRMSYIILVISLFNSVTTTNEIVYGIERITDPLHIKRDSNIILYVSLLFKFPNIFNYELKKIIKIYKERGIIKNSNLKIYVDIISKSFNYTLEILNNMFTNMKMSLYGYGKTRTNYRLNKFGIKEVLILLLEIIILIIIIVY